MVGQAVQGILEAGEQAGAVKAATEAASMLDAYIATLTEKDMLSRAVEVKFFSNDAKKPPSVIFSFRDKVHITADMDLTQLSNDFRELCQTTIGKRTRDIRRDNFAGTFPEPTVYFPAAEFVEMPLTQKTIDKLRAKLPVDIVLPLDGPVSKQLTVARTAHAQLTERRLNEALDRLDDMIKTGEISPQGLLAKMQARYGAAGAKAPD